MAEYDGYGSYDSYGEDEEPSAGRHWVRRLLKWALFCLLLGVCGILIFRMVFSGYYPAEMKQLYFTPALTAYYEANGGVPGALTQDLRINYDNSLYSEEEQRPSATFFAAYPVYVPENGSLQFTLRCNEDALSLLAEEKGLTEIPPATEETFEFSLVDNLGNRYYPEHIEYAEKLFYRYLRLAFEGVSFSDDVKWIRVDIYYKGEPIDYEENPRGAIPVYENNEDYGVFVPYELSGKEKP